MSSERGVTLFETLAALVLFAVSAAVIGQFLVQHIRFAGSNHRRTVAYALAEGELEDLRSRDYKEIEDQTKYEQVDGRQYTIATQVVSDDPGPNMKKIRVDVAWNEPRGEQHVTVYTVYTEIQR